jgi:hypothetical protein
MAEQGVRFEAIPLSCIVLAIKDGKTISRQIIQCSNDAMVNAALRAVYSDAGVPLPTSASLGLDCHIRTTQEVAKAESASCAQAQGMDVKTATSANILTHPSDNGYSVKAPSASTFPTADASYNMAGLDQQALSAVLSVIRACENPGRPVGHTPNAVSLVNEWFQSRYGTACGPSPNFECHEGKFTADALIGVRGCESFVEVHTGQYSSKRDAKYQLYDKIWYAIRNLGERVHPATKLGKV